MYFLRDQFEIDFSHILARYLKRDIPLASEGPTENPDMSNLPPLESLVEETKLFIKGRPDLHAILDEALTIGEKLIERDSPPPNNPFENL